MTRYLLLAICLACPFVSPAAQPFGGHGKGPFSIARLDRELAEGANAVVRLDSNHFEIQSAGKARLSKHLAITVLSRSGSSDATLVVPYNDELQKVARLKGRVIGADGKKIRDISSDEQVDVPANLNPNEFEKSRMRIVEPVLSYFPVTLEYEFEIEYNGLISWPEWSPYGRGLPIESTVFEIEAPSLLPIRFQDRGLNVIPDRSDDGRRQRIVWRTRSAEKFEEEPWGPDLDAQLPKLRTAPTAFEIEGIPGNMGTWSSFANWYYRLSLGRDALPFGAKREIGALVEGAEDDVEAVRRVYRYMQDRTRYVSVQLGIGGWQPHPATYVHERQYGDCKALTNYTISLLGAAGIEAFPALIRNGFGTRDIEEDFPSNEFNHVVVFVPLDADTLWLETTSQTMPFGFIGASNEDRYALVVNSREGTLVRTPVTTFEQNRLTRKGKISLLTNGGAMADVKATYEGNRLVRVLTELGHSSESDREDWLRSEITASDFDILASNFDEVDTRRDSVSILTSLGISRYGSRTGTRMFVRPNLFGTEFGVPPELEERNQPVVLRFAFSDRDSLLWLPPADYRVEALPAPVELETDFGRFVSRSDTLSDGSIQFVREFEIRQSKIAPEQYDELRSFLLAVRRADEQSMVLIR